MWGHRSVERESDNASGVVPVPDTRIPYRRRTDRPA
jgi:hypothetical protein